MTYYSKTEANDEREKTFTFQRVRTLQSSSTYLYERLARVPFKIRNAASRIDPDRTRPISQELTQHRLVCNQRYALRDDKNVSREMHFER